MPSYFPQVQSLNSLLTIIVTNHEWSIKSSAIYWACLWFRNTSLINCQQLSIPTVIVLGQLWSNIQIIAFPQTVESIIFVASYNFFLWGRQMYVREDLCFVNVLCLFQCWTHITNLVAWIKQNRNQQSVKKLIWRVMDSIFDPNRNRSWSSFVTQSRFGGKFGGRWV